MVSARGSGLGNECKGSGLCGEGEIDSLDLQAPLPMVVLWSLVSQCGKFADCCLSRAYPLMWA